MPALFDDAVLDAALDEIATATTLHICEGTPADFTAVGTSSLASVALTSGDFTKANHATSGRQVTVAAKAGVSVAETGTPGHYCLVDGTTLLARTEVNPASPDLTQNSTVDIPAVTFSVADPVVE